MKDISDIINSKIESIQILENYIEISFENEIYITIGMKNDKWSIGVFNSDINNAIHRNDKIRIEQLEKMEEEIRNFTKLDKSRFYCYLCINICKFNGYCKYLIDKIASEEVEC